MKRSFRPGAQRRSHYAPSKQHKTRQPAAIHASKFINQAVAAEAELPYEPEHTFHTMGLNKRTVATLDYIGYKIPSPIQDQCIIPALAGRDIIGLANTGTGKTAAFLLPIIEKLYSDRTPVTALVLAPTRELAQQIDEEFRRFSAGQKMYSVLVVGGANINRQIQQIKRGPQIVSGTPGRIEDLIDRRVLRLSGVTTFVLDEADRMCDMGFVRDIRAIAAELPQARQTFCYSATMTPDVQRIVEEFMVHPHTVSVVKNETNVHIEQDVMYVRDKAHKIELLTELLQKPEFTKTIVFGDTKYSMQRLSDTLVKNGIKAAAIHGNKSQAQRERALKSFKTGEVDVLVATDVAARGLDIPNVSHVINFDPPKVYADYVHRIGRTGRAGNTGNALTFMIGNPANTTAQHTPAPAHRPPRKPRRQSFAATAEDRLVRLSNGLDA